MGGVAQWVWRDGCRLTPAMLHDFLALDGEFHAITGEHLRISDGIRLDEDQERIFRDRYRVQWWGTGPFNDVRWWQGLRWVRIKDGGTVAPPGSSNHQINVAAGRRGALDLYDTGRDAGILTRGSWRANVFDQIAPKYGYDSEGYAFGEAWHKRYNRDPWRAVPASSGAQPLPTPEQEEDEMTLIRIKGKAGARRGGLYAIIGRKAIFLGDVRSDAPLIEDDAAIAALQAEITGLK